MTQIQSLALYIKIYQEPLLAATKIYINKRMFSLGGQIIARAIVCMKNIRLVIYGQFQMQHRTRIAVGVCLCMLHEFNDL